MKNVFENIIVLLFVLNFYFISIGDSKGSGGGRGGGRGSGSSGRGSGSSGRGGTSGRGSGARATSAGSRRSSVGSLSSSSRVAAGTTLGFLAGAAVGSRLGTGGGHYYYRHYHGRNYYYGYGSTYHSDSDDKEICVFDLDGSSYEGKFVDPNTNQPAKQLAFECSHYENCCGLDCCSGWSWWHYLLLLFGVGIAVSLCCACGVKCRNKRLAEKYNNDNDVVNTTAYVAVPVQPPTNYDSSATNGPSYAGYPVQTQFPPAYGGYPNTVTAYTTTGYPSAGAYPTYPPQPQPYTSAAPSYHQFAVQ